MRGGRNCMTNVDNERGKKLNDKKCNDKKKQ